MMATPMKLLTISADNRLTQNMLFPLCLETHFCHLDNLFLNDGSKSHLSRWNNNKLHYETENHNEQQRIMVTRVIGFGVTASKGNRVWQNERQN